MGKLSSLRFFYFFRGSPWSELPCWYTLKAKGIIKTYAHYCYCQDVSVSLFPVRHLAFEGSCLKHSFTSSPLLVVNCSTGVPGVRAMP